MRTNDNGIDRDMTEIEETEFKAFLLIGQAEAKARADAQTAKDTARQAILDKLGLNAEEAALLFS
jgi:hypothetical protein